MGFKGDLLTWSNKHESDTYTNERLNRAVANSNWVEMLDLVFVESLVSRCSDHKPLLLSCGHLSIVVRKKEMIFRYEASWDMDIEYSSKIE